MFDYGRISELNDYFTDYKDRENKKVYFYRIVEYSPKIDKFIGDFLKDSRKLGIYLDKKIPNPNEGQLNYFEEIIGLDFKLEQAHLNNKLKKWLPRLSLVQNKSILESMIHFLMKMKSEGKNENILKNIYIKFMCWLYYKFERVLANLGKEKPPKILYQGDVSSYELAILTILAKSGCDVLILCTGGEKEYAKVDPRLKESMLFKINDGIIFPQNFSPIKIMEKLKTDIAQDQMIQSIESSKKVVVTNTWLTGEPFEDVLKVQEKRGVDKNLYYNIFTKIEGVSNESSYLNDLLCWKLKLDSMKKSIMLLEKPIKPPEIDEVKKIERGNYKDVKQMIIDLSKNLKYKEDIELEKLIKMGFIEIFKEISEEPLQKLTNIAVTILCWFNRYKEKLFNKIKEKELTVYIQFGAIHSRTEEIWLKFISRLPIDVLIICPDLDLKDNLEGKLLFIKSYEKTMHVEKFPSEIKNIQVGTTAYQAEQDLNTLLYQDTGVYRNKQFKKAIPITLKTTFEEINILWKEEAKFRPGFEVLEDRVMVPTIFSKISGVPNENSAEYWKMVTNLVTEDTFIMREIPFTKGTDANPIKSSVNNFIKNGKMDIGKIKNHSAYQYSYIREDMQDFIFDKLQQLIDSKVIKGTFREGSEYTILSTVLNLNKEILRLIQKYDFTKTIPKLVVLSLKESICSLEDSIIIAFLNLMGFDILMFVPTGYQSVEKYYESKIFLEHQVGEYVYDMRAPNFSLARNNARRSGGIIESLFGRRR